MLSAKNLDIYYGKKLAVTGVNMEIQRRQVTALIGPSGCGKSTFLKSLNRIGELDSPMRVQGKVEFLGQDIYSPRVNLQQLRIQIGMVFQKPNPFPMSIYDNIAYGPRLNGASRRAKLDDIIETSLVQAALWDEVKHKLHQSALGLSGGQQQRLCIARSLAVSPKVLLMDEPCSALDPIATLKIEELIKQLQEHLTIVIVTHNLQQAARVAQQTGFFSVDMKAGEAGAGQLVEYGPTQRIFEAPSHQRTRDYVSGRFG
ncbi:phosphate ABC transporter ATP-binding protein PstB [Leptolyngbya sp. FACHB-261]|uniref:phosphate ABC transporter ATP-binding protein PstB n=1 Tax=Leptolyngbya sp. FACHB-261 TaxID=2692806 RepID=UPI001685E1BC|nr:phosphate ABC transporter ATP-binding protein PstB [Leptolyngbya sp. FACHB-261]MBD2099390.1 phosphate ABC transporter ATP-binding protein [Leptolyngbya sp. FACHB-261]